VIICFFGHKYIPFEIDETYPGPGRCLRCDILEKWIVIWIWRSKGFFSRTNIET
jgi:hypothetical protein